MRSFDYCHFEINIGLENQGGLTLVQIDSARKEAARLADKAVEQYKIHKRVAQRAENGRGGISSWKKEADVILEIAETDRDERQKAVLKAYQDACYESNRQYDYEDDWQDDE